MSEHTGGNCEKRNESELEDTDEHVGKMNVSDFNTELKGNINRYVSCYEVDI